MKRKKSEKGERTRSQTPYYTEHATKRMSQRNISTSDVTLAMHYGQKLHRTGIVFFFLGKNDIPEAMQKILDYLEGTVVLFNPGTAEVITVYRHREGLRKIKRKVKYSIPKQYLSRM